MELKTYRKGDITVQKFLSNVYSWLCEPRNRYVEDFHYSCADCSESIDLDELLKNREMRTTIRMFLQQRMIQGEQIALNTLPNWFLSKATTKYIYNMYN